MRISDAEPGSVLMDKDGALWLKGDERARCIYDPNNDDDTGDRASPDAQSIVDMQRVESFGPFVLMVPEPPADA